MRIEVLSNCERGDDNMSDNESEAVISVYGMVCVLFKNVVGQNNRLFYVFRYL